MKQEINYEEYIKELRIQAYDFLDRVPFSELTAILKNKLGVENLDIKYNIIEKPQRNDIGLFIAYESNDLTEDSKLLSAVYREYRLESFGLDRLWPCLQNGQKFDPRLIDDLITDFENFDTDQKITFKLYLLLHVSYVNADGGMNGSKFGYATYDENTGWIVEEESR